MDRTVVDQADLRAAGARALIERSLADETVSLAALSALDLCVLGATRQVLFEELPARAWGGMSERARRRARQTSLESLVRRRHLMVVADLPGVQGEAYAPSPPLGIVLAARSRPSFALACAIEGSSARTMRMFALGDEADSVQAVVVEIPEEAPGGPRAGLARLGPLGWLYHYVLVSDKAAAAILAEWAVQRTGEHLSSDGRTPGRSITVLRHDEGRELVGLNILARGDGERARIERDGGPPLECDVAELTEMIATIFTLGNQ